MQQGNLYLIPTVLAENATQTIPAYIRDIIMDTDFYIVENLKTARRFIKSIIKKRILTNVFFWKWTNTKTISLTKIFLVKFLMARTLV